MAKDKRRFDDHNEHAARLQAIECPITWKDTAKNVRQSVSKLLSHVEFPILYDKSLASSQGCT